MSVAILIAQAENECRGSQAICVEQSAGAVRWRRGTLVPQEQQYLKRTLARLHLVSLNIAWCVTSVTARR